MSKVSEVYGKNSVDLLNVNISLIKDIKMRKEDIEFINALMKEFKNYSEGQCASLPILLITAHMCFGGTSDVDKKILKVLNDLIEKGVLDLCGVGYSLSKKSSFDILEKELMSYYR